jgi:hypothetical protein
MERRLVKGSSFQRVLAGVAALAFVAGAVSLLPATGSAQAPRIWVEFTVDQGASMGTDSSVVVNLAGRPHVAYRDAASSTLKYAAMNFAGAFITETVSGTLGGGDFPSLAVASGLRPRIAYYHGAGGDLRFATKDAGAWLVLTLDEGGDVGANASLALDPGEFAHITYDDRTNHTVKYMGAGPAGWVTETIGSGEASDLAVDIGGNPHVSFHDPASGALMYATRRATAGWTVQTVADGPQSGPYNAIALDEDGRPLVAYYNGQTRDLLLATRSGTGVWTSAPVDESGDVGTYVDFAIDELQRRHLSYFDATAGTVKYALFAGTAWEIEPVASTGGLPPRTSIGYGGRTGAHISYHATWGDTTALKLAGHGYPTPTPTLTATLGTPGPGTPSTPGTVQPSATWDARTPTPSRTATWDARTPSPTATATWDARTPSPTATATWDTRTPSPTATPTWDPRTPSPTATPTWDPRTPSPTATATWDARTPSPTGTATWDPRTPTGTPTVLGTVTPTRTRSTAAATVFLPLTQTN